jgi:hypothetical protein
MRAVPSFPSVLNSNLYNHKISYLSVHNLAVNVMFEFIDITLCDILNTYGSEMSGISTYKCQHVSFIFLSQIPSANHSDIK